MKSCLSAVVMSLAFLGMVGWAVAQEKPLSDPVIGTADAEGNLALHVFSPGAKRPDIARLTTDYGVVMCRAKDGWVLFVLGDRAKKSVREFSNYNEFLSALDELPKEATLTIYDRCLMPVFYDFYPVHAELRRKFEKACEKRSLKVAKEPKITCTCAEGG